MASDVSRAGQGATALVRVALGFANRAFGNPVPSCSLSHLTGFFPRAERVRSRLEGACGDDRAQCLRDLTCSGCLDKPSVVS